MAGGGGRLHLEPAIPRVSTWTSTISCSSSELEELFEPLPQNKTHLHAGGLGELCRKTGLRMRQPFMMALLGSKLLSWVPLQGSLAASGSLLLQSRLVGFVSGRTGLPTPQGKAGFATCRQTNLLSSLKRFVVHFSNVLKG